MTTAQMTDKEIKEMLDRNNLEISFDSKKSKWVLTKDSHLGKYRLGSSEFKTVLIVTARTLDKKRFN